MDQIYAALDVSDKTTHICVVDGAGTIVRRGVCATDPQALATVLKKRCPGIIRVVLGTGPLSAFLYHGLIEQGLPAICVCARHAEGVTAGRTRYSITIAVKTVLSCSEYRPIKSRLANAGASASSFNPNVRSSKSIATQASWKPRYCPVTGYWHL